MLFLTSLLESIFGGEGFSLISLIIAVFEFFFGGGGAG